MSIDEVMHSQFCLFVWATAYETDAEKEGLGGNGWKKWRLGEGSRVSLEHLPWFRDHPVVNVSWNDAQAFCQWLSEQEGVTYRLPTEAEWEYACRAGSITRYSYGDDESFLQEHAWSLDNSVRSTHPVGLKTANAWGLFDLYGNAFEWCQDEFFGLYSETPAVDPTRSAAAKVGADITASDRVLRGGSFSTQASIIISCPGSAWERAAPQAPPATRSSKEERRSKNRNGKGGGASKTVRSQAEPGNEENGRSVFRVQLSLRSDRGNWPHARPP